MLRTQRQIRAWLALVGLIASACSGGPIDGTPPAARHATPGARHAADQFRVDRPGQLDSPGHADGAALAEDLLGRAVLPRLLRTLLNVENPIKDEPDDTALAEHVDLNAIRRLVSTALPD